MTVPTVTSSTELEEVLNDPAKLAELNKDPGGFAKWIGNYAASINREDPEFNRQLQAQANQAVKDFLEGEKTNINAEMKEQIQLHLLNAVRTTEAGKTAHHVSLSDARKMHAGGTLGAVGWGARNALYNEAAPGARLEDMFSDMADYLRTIWHNAGQLPDDPKVRNDRLDVVRKLRNDYGSTVPADGGFLIPETLRSEIMMISLETAVTRPRARVIPMESLTVPIPAVDTTTNATSVFGGIVCYWTEEGAVLIESQATFRQVVLQARKLTAYAEVPNELIQDATAFGAFFNQVYPAAMAWYEDDAFINGSGVGEPDGWLNADAAVSVAKEAGQPAATIVWENIAKMYARMLPSSLGSAVWVASIDTFPELATMALSVGTGGSAIWINNGVEGPPVTILGRPVLFTEKTAVLGTVGDLNFVDLGYYLIGDRQTMQASSSPHYKFANDLTAYKFTSRVDGKPWLNSAITPKNGGPTLTPFVKIATRA